MNDSLLLIARWATALAPPPSLRYQRTGRYSAQDGLALIALDLAGPAFNTVVAIGESSPPPDEVFRLAEEFFAGRAGDWGVTVEGGAEHPLEQEVLRRGWELIEQEPAMVLPAIPNPVPALPGLTVHRVTDQRTLRDYQVTADAGFAPPGGTDAAGPSISEAFVPSLACALDPDIAPLIGYADDGQPVAAATLLRIDQTALISGVAVLPAYRRRGYGEAITGAAIGEGAARGCTTAALRASAMGYPVYLRMGFVPVCRFVSYAPP